MSTPKTSRSTRRHTHRYVRPGRPAARPPVSKAPKPSPSGASDTPKRAGFGKPAPTWQPWLLTLVSILLFFTIAFSDVSTLPKAVILIALLVGTGEWIARMTGWESWFGVLLLRGKNGFHLMRVVADNHPKLSLWLADVGLTMGLGLPYGYYVFVKRKVKGVSTLDFLIHAVLAILLFAILSGNTSGPQAPNAIMGFVAMLLFGLAGLAAYFLFSNAFNVLTVPNTPPGLAPVIPGVTIPWEGIIAIGIIAAVHELAHGVIALIEKIPLKSSGALLLGWLPVGAFVEPDEDEFTKAPLHAKRRVLVAGSQSNLLFFFVFLALTFALASLQPVLTQNVVIAGTNAGLGSAAPGMALLANGTVVLAINGQRVHNTNDVFTFLETRPNAQRMIVQTPNGNVTLPTTMLNVVRVRADSPNANVLINGDTLLSLNGTPVQNVDDLRAVLQNQTQGATLTAQTSRGVILLTLGEGGKIGAEFTNALPVDFKDKAIDGLGGLLDALKFIVQLLGLTALLNFALAMFNLLPVFITDGHRLVLEELLAYYGPKREEKAKLISKTIGFIFLAVLILNLLPWLWKR